jgi:hypothetical protein
MASASGGPAQPAGAQTGWAWRGTTKGKADRQRAALRRGSVHRRRCRRVHTSADCAPGSLPRQYGPHQRAVNEESACDRRRDARVSLGVSDHPPLSTFVQCPARGIEHPHKAAGIQTSLVQAFVPAARSGTARTRRPKLEFSCARRRRSANKRPALRRVGREAETPPRAQISGDLDG